MGVTGFIYNEQAEGPFELHEIRLPHVRFTWEMTRDQVMSFASKLSSLSKLSIVV
jgi:hypothetical protein